MRDEIVIQTPRNNFCRLLGARERYARMREVSGVVMLAPIVGGVWRKYDLLARMLHTLKPVL